MHVPDSPTLNKSYASHDTTPPGNRLQHHFTTLHRTMGSVSLSSCANSSPYNRCPRSKKCRMNVLAALGSEVGRKGRRRKGISSAVCRLASSSSHSSIVSRYLGRLIPNKRRQGKERRGRAREERTSTLQLYRTPSQQLLHLLRLNSLPCPCIFPSRGRRGFDGYILLSAFLALNFRRPFSAFGAREESHSVVVGYLFTRILWS